MDDDFIQLADGGDARGSGGEIVPLVDGGEQEIELALEFRAVLGEGGQGDDTLRGGFLRGEFLKGGLRGTHLVEKRQEVQGGEIRGGSRLFEIRDEGGHFPALLVVSQAVEGVAMEGNDFHESGGNRDVLACMVLGSGGLHCRRKRDVRVSVRGKTK